MIDFAFKFIAYFVGIPASFVFFISLDLISCMNTTIAVFA